MSSTSVNWYHPRHHGISKKNILFLLQPLPIHGDKANTEECRPSKNHQLTALTISTPLHYLPPTTAATTATLPSSTSTNSPLSITSPSSSNQVEVIKKLQEQAKSDLLLFCWCSKISEKIHPEIQSPYQVDSIVSSLETIYKEAKKQEHKASKKRALILCSMMLPFVFFPQNFFLLSKENWFLPRYSSSFELFWKTSPVYRQLKQPEILIFARSTQQSKGWKYKMAWHKNQ